MASTIITKFIHLQIPLEDVAKATKNFHPDNIISRGGFGPAYKGRLLQSGMLITIAARRLDRKNGEGDVEFLTEISMLSELKHKNIVSLIGFCDEKGEKIIITTYEANGSLGGILNSPDLTWIRILKICLGVARALRYLHLDDGRGYSVIHRNINSDTILLDDNFEAKLSGFEICIKQSVNRMDRVVLCEPIGVMGYMDPEIENTGGVTHKSDVYAFGVVLFEILYGRKAYVKHHAKRLLVRLVKYDNENETPLRDIIHPDLWKQTILESVIKYSYAASSCLEEQRAHRPDMEYMVAELEKALELQMPREVLGKNLEHLKIPLDYIQLATDDFSDACNLADIPFYSFYGAKIHSFDRESPSSSTKEENVGELPNMVVKRLRTGQEEQGVEMFFTELEMLSRIKHHNIITLFGFCVEGSEKILVHEYLSQGNLSCYLDEDSSRGNLTWEKRLKICMDIAYALHYLHYEMEDQKAIINRNINSENIWLDENLGAKIADFGFSIFLPLNSTDNAIYLKRLLGEKAYTDPEYAITRKLKRESDVYSFGVVLFEILCGRSANNADYLAEGDEGLAYAATRCFCNGTIAEIIDPLIKKEINENGFDIDRRCIKHSLDTFCKIAYKCVARNQEQRPTMKVVIKKLTKALNVLEGRVSNIYQLANQVESAFGRQMIPNIDQVVQSLGFALDLNLAQENIAEERIQHSNTEQQSNAKQKEHVVGTPTEHQVERIQDSNREQQLNMKQKQNIVGAPTEHQLKLLKQMKIPLNDIILATDNFSEDNAVQFAPYHMLFRAELNYFDITNSLFVKGKVGEIEQKHPMGPVVIKRFLPRNDEQGEPLYYTSMAMLMNAKHPNIVTLLGFCVEGSEMILVMEDVSNGYLGDYLGKVEMRSFTWEKRLEICIEVAQALNYLHCEMEDQKIIINRHIKSQNIGFDDNWGAKIVEFEFAIFLPHNQEDGALHLERIVGNHYYIDPEYDSTGKLKRESDVYSFGVILLEILCGRIAFDPLYTKESDRGLAPLARQRFFKGTLEEMIDPVIKEGTLHNNFTLDKGPNMDSLHTFIKIALQCVMETQDQRPTMKMVLEELEKALHFQTKKDNLRISLEDIKMATSDFDGDNCIGSGGFGSVYKGNLQDGAGFKTIVAKRLDTRFGQGKKEFLSELQILWEYKHNNVICLIGYCDEKDENIIIYEYASRGSLDKYLNNASLTWMKRLNICIDVARALDFLHGGVEKQAKVIHRDIKTPNILLSEDWEAKLADFGLSLISPINPETDYVIDHVCGTRGYLDPIYKESGFLTIESDIYSFGVVLFEILYGRSTSAVHKHEGLYLQDFIKKKFEEGKHDEVVFEQIREQIVPESLIAFQEIAYQCLHLEREKRPTTEEILMQLEMALAFQISKGD